MTFPSPDPLPRLADALTEVSARLKDIGDEIRVLQTAPSPTPAPADPTLAPAPEPPLVPMMPPWAGYGPPPAPPLRPPQYSPLPPPPLPHYPTPPSRPRREPGPSLWDRVSRDGAGSRILAWVGGVVTLAGVVLLLVLAIQRGYIGPLPRVLVGAGLGAVLVAVGLRLHRTEAGRIGGRAVAGTGFACLYLDVIAATSIYEFLPSAAGLAVGLVVSAAGAALAVRWNFQPLAVFVVLAGALSAPVLTGLDQPVLFVGFLLVLQIAAMPVHLVRGWTALAIAANVPPSVAVFLLAAYGHGAVQDQGTLLALCVIAGAVQVVVASVTAMRGRHDLATAFVLCAPVPILLAGALAGPPSGVAAVAGFATLLAAVWVLQRLQVLPASEPFGLSAGAGAAVGALEAVCLGFDGSARVGSLLAGGLLLALLGGTQRYRGAVIASAVFGGLGFLLGLDGALRPDYVAGPPLYDVPASNVAAAGTAGALLAAAALALAWALGRCVEDVAVRRAGWVAGGLLALFGSTVAIVSLGLATSPDERGFLAGHVAVTLTWTVTALVLLVRYVGSTPLRVAGLALVGAAVVKLVVFDLASLNGIPRVLSFLGAGLVLLAAGARYAGRTPSPPTTPPADAEQRVAA